MKQFMQNQHTSGKTGTVVSLLAATVILLGTFSVTSTHAANAANGTGVGIVLGEPSGLSVKLPQGAQSINLILGYDLDGPGWNDNDPGCCDDDARIYFGGDYVWYNYGLIRVPRGRLPLYYGPGLWVSLFNQARLGIRGVVGLEYQFATAPFDIFLEIGPRLSVFPDTDGDVFAGLGARFFF